MIIFLPLKSKKKYPRAKKLPTTNIRTNFLRLRETHNALQLPVSGISGNSEQKAIIQTTKELIQYTVIQIQFQSLKYTVVIRIRKHLSNFPFRPKR